MINPESEVVLFFHSIFILYSSVLDFGPVPGAAGPRYIICTAFFSVRLPVSYLRITNYVVSRKLKIRGWIQRAGQHYLGDH